MKIFLFVSLHQRRVVLPHGERLKTGFTPKSYTSDKVAVTNPLTWTTDDNAVAKTQNKGSVLRKLKKVYPALCSAQVVPKDGILWTDKPKFFGSFLLKTSNYHIADFNFYYMNVRENAQERAAAFLAKQPVTSNQ